MKKHKKLPEKPSKPKVVKEESLLKMGQNVLYLTDYTVDKATVDKVDKEKKQVTLSNGIKLNAVIPASGMLISLNSSRQATIMPWDEHAESVYEYTVAKRNIPTQLRALENAISKGGLGREDTIKVSVRLEKLLKLVNNE